jgi:hypothetical protein
MAPRFRRAGTKGKYPYDEFNRLLDEVERQSKLTIYGADFDDSKTGRVISVRFPPRIWRVVVSTVPNQDDWPGIYLVKKRYYEDDTAGPEFPVHSDNSDHAVDDEFDVYYPENGTEYFYEDDAPVRWKEMGGPGKGFEVSWGVATSSLWVPGTNVITLNPSLQNGDPIDGDPVDVYVDIPLQFPARYCGARTGDILAYIRIGADPDSSPTYLLLHNPPPWPTAQYQVFSNTSSVGTSPDVKFTKLQAAT